MSVEAASSARQKRANESIERAREEVRAVVGAVALIERAPVVDIPAAVDKTRQLKSLTEQGAIVSSPSYREKLVAMATARQDKIEKKASGLEKKVTVLSYSLSFSLSLVLLLNLSLSSAHHCTYSQLPLRCVCYQVRSFYKKWAPLIREAECDLAEARRLNPTPQGTGLTPLRVKALNALIVARTGHLPKAKNNKDGALKAEAAACLANPVIIHTPPPSPTRTAGERGAVESECSDDEQSDGSECGLGEQHVSALDFTW